MQSRKLCALPYPRRVMDAMCWLSTSDMSDRRSRGRHHTHMLNTPIRSKIPTVLHNAGDGVAAHIRTHFLSVYDAALPQQCCFVTTK